MNLLSTLGTAAATLYGGPEAGAIAGSLLGGGSTAGGTANTALDGLGNGVLGGQYAASSAAQTLTQVQEMRFQDRMAQQNAVFDESQMVRSQEMKEVNQLRDVAMQQRKADDSITKEFIQSIKS